MQAYRIVGGVEALNVSGAVELGGESAGLVAPVLRVAQIEVVNHLGDVPERGVIRLPAGQLSQALVMRSTWIPFLVTQVLPRTLRSERIAADRLDPVALGGWSSSSASFSKDSTSPRAGAAK